MAGKSAAAAKGRAKLEAFKAARAKKAKEETVPIDEPKPRPAAVAEPAPAVVAPPTKPDVDARVAVLTRDVPPPPSVPDPPPPAPRARPEDSSFPRDANASAGSLSSAYAALSDEYLPPARDVETLDAPRPTLGEAPGPRALARDAGTVGAGTLGDVENVENAEDPEPTSDPVLAETLDLEPPPFVSPFKPTRPTALERPRTGLSSSSLEPFAPAIKSSTFLSRFETVSNVEPRDAASARLLPRRMERSVAVEPPARVSGRFPGPSFADDRARRLAEASEVEALQRVIDDMTRERMALQRGLDKQQALMQTLAEENERFTTELNARAEEAARLRDANGRATAAIRARDDALALAVEARDVAKAAALDAHERAARSAVETVELEEKLRAARSEALRLRSEMEREMTDRERRDRAARAATADRDEMATAIEGLRREREFLRAKLRDAAAREEREMEREMGDGRWERGGGDDDDSDEESPGGSAPRNTPARQMDPRARAARLAADLRDASSGGASFLSSGGGDGVGTPNGDETSSAPSGFFHFVSANGARATGGATVGDVGEDQLRLVDSIHELLSEVERERARAKRALEAAGENARTLEATNAALERRLAGKRELQAEGAARDFRDASENVSRGAVGGSDASDASDDASDSDDSDAWSDDDVGTTPRRRRGFFSSLNPFARR